MNRYLDKSDLTYVLYTNITYLQEHAVKRSDGNNGDMKNEEEEEEEDGKKEKAFHSKEINIKETEMLVMVSFILLHAFMYIYR